MSGSGRTDREVTCDCCGGPFIEAFTVNGVATQHSGNGLKGAVERRLRCRDCRLYCRTTDTCKRRTA